MGGSLTTAASAALDTWPQLLDEAREGHVVQFYRSTAFLAAAVGVWLAGSLRRGGGGIVIGTPHHAEVVRDALRREGLDPGALEGAGRLVVLDADAAMRAFMVDGKPDARKFSVLVGKALRHVRAQLPEAGADVRAWGEMVDLLRQRGNLAAAQQLEDLWDALLPREDLRLLCSYSVDNFETVRQQALFRALTASHAHLVPEEHDRRLHDAVALAMREVFGDDAPRVWATVATRAPRRPTMPAGEAALIGLLTIAPQLGARVLSRARHHYKPVPAQA